jgi:amino acid adenylation domain-containing protein
MSDSLHAGFLRSVDRFPDRPAIEVDGTVLSYRELHGTALSIAAAIQQSDSAPDAQFTAVFASRSPTAYAGVLGALLAGHAYVPLNRAFPVERTKSMLVRSGAHTIVVDRNSADQLEEVLRGIETELCILSPEDINWSNERARWPQHRFLNLVDLPPAAAWREPNLAQDPLSYLLFTSGSTGTPKGVMVMQRNVRSYVEFITGRYAITEQDRFSQMFDLTFDLSAADMFVAWERGACVCCPSERALIAPRSFVRDRGITIWFSVPSTCIFMKRLGMLKPNLYPGLRVSMFCGEALRVEDASDWQKAAPNSVVENLYGPTELTIACTFYRWNEATSPSVCELGTVPIGQPFPGMEAIIVDHKLMEVEPGVDGELLMTGSQLTKGYLDDSERTATAFVIPPGKSKVFYRTGDRVRCALGGAMSYLGRLDNQVKILGHRVELGEVEAAARHVSGVDAAIAVPYPMTPAGAGGLELFLQAADGDTALIIRELSRVLPSYMVPRNVHLVSRFPLNPNGKFDRRALANRLERMHEHRVAE